jgi:hypothetical protein
VRRSWSICVLLLHLLGAAPATRPSTNPTAAALDKQIAEAIIQLDSPDSATREKATTKLINLGPRVLRPLKAAIHPDSTPEFTTRAQFILTEIASQWRYVDQNGGNIVSGFQAILGGKPEAQAGKPLSLVLVFRCVGSTGGALMETRTVDIELSNTNALFSHPDSEGKLIIRKIGDDKLPAGPSPLVCNSGPPHAIDFYIGGSVNTSLWIDKELQLPPGEYDIQFIYYARSKKLLKEALEDLESNALRIRVVAR